MQPDDFDHRASIRYQPDEKPPVALTIGLGLQLAILCIAGVVLTPAIVIRAAGASVVSHKYAYESAGPFGRRLRCSSSRGTRHCSS